MCAKNVRNALLLLAIGVVAYGVGSSFTRSLEAAPPEWVMELMLEPETVKLLPWQYKYCDVPFNEEYLAVEGPCVVHGILLTTTWFNLSLANGPVAEGDYIGRFVFLLPEETQFIPLDVVVDHGLYLQLDAAGEGRSVLTVIYRRL